MKILLLAIVYFGAARLGFFLSDNPGSVTAVFPPSGIALGALLIFGWRIWPGIFLGSFSVNCLIFFSGPNDVNFLAGILMSTGIGLGASIQAIAGRAVLIQSKTAFSLFDQPRNIFVLYLFSGLACCLINATIGTTSLYLGGVVSWEEFKVLWLTWWLGDSVGIFVFAPLTVWLKGMKHLEFNPKLLGEYFVVLFLVVIFSGVSFNNWFLPGISNYPLQFIIMPFLLWVTLRFGEAGLLPAITISSLISIVGTMNGHGPFFLGDPNLSLLYLQSYIGIVFLTFLVLNAVINQRAFAQRSAELANSAKSNFLSRMSHELRTPLNAILGFAQLMASDPREPLSFHQKKYMETIRKAGSHLLSLINEILDLSQVETEVVPITSEPVEVSSLMEEVLGLMKPIAEKGDVTLINNLEPGRVIMVKADGMRLKQILINLVSNAIKYNQKNGSVWVSSEEIQDGLVQIHVKDTGIGLSEEQKLKLFKPFERLGAEATKVQGTGIGLSISRKLIRLMNGRINVESQWGKGSCFTVELPSEPVKYEAIEARPAKDQMGLEKEEV